MSELDRRGHTRTAYFCLRRKYSNKLTFYGEQTIYMSETAEMRTEDVKPVAPPVEVETPTVTQTPQGAGV